MGGLICSCWASSWWLVNVWGRRRVSRSRVSKVREVREVREVSKVRKVCEGEFLWLAVGVLQWSAGSDGFCLGFEVGSLDWWMGFMLPAFGWYL